MTLTIQDVIDRLLEPAKTKPNPAETVDKLLFGDAAAPVSGIAVAFMATTEAIEKAIALGANLLITHEGAFFSHSGSLTEGDTAYAAKRELIERSGLAIFRLHDHIHRYEPDGITAGLVQALQWEAHLSEHRPYHAIVQIPETTVAEVAMHVKQTLGIPFVRVVGELNLPVSRIGILAGYRGGGATAIPVFARDSVDLVLYGEGPEWETPAYVRDAVRQGERKALIVLGHEESEDPGMKLAAERLRASFPGVPVHHISSRPLFVAI